MITVQALGGLTADERASLLQRGRAIPDEVLTKARDIIERVRRDGDKALLELTREFDKEDATAIEFPVRAPELDADLRAAIDQAIVNVQLFHERGRLQPFEYEAIDGAKMARMIVPYARAGVYVPGGLAPYPSTVIMACVPARLAGVKEIVLCTPPDPHPAILYAADRCGVARLFGVGGAQAIAAMAYGTQTVPACDIVVGPGNVYVNAAKKLVSDDVAIDFLAGPTEIMIVWDGEGRADFVASEMIAQAEHASDATAILLAASTAAADAVVEELKKRVPACDRADIIGASLARSGRIFVAGIDAAVDFANAYAPEHLLLAVKYGDRLLPKIRTAGAVSVGLHASVALADYGSGPNHILPTMGWARRTSGLSANTFVRTVPVQTIDAAGARTMGPGAARLAREEGLTAHAAAIELRMK